MVGLVGLVNRDLIDTYSACFLFSNAVGLVQAVGFDPFPYLPALVSACIIHFLAQANKNISFKSTV